MPFCRKCGRRLQEYSEVCSDCGTSTTAPIINTKRTQSNHLLRNNDPSKIAKVMIPHESPVKTKVIAYKPVKAVASRKVATSAQAGTPRTVLTNTAPSIITQAKAAPSPKPVISAKHIVKPKRVQPSKPIAPFTISFARPVAKPITQSIPAAPARPTIQKPIVIATPVAQQKIVPQTKPIVTAAKATPPPKPVTPAPVYPPHEIIKSNISLKEDITSNPHDYEKESFDFDLECPNRHFWRAGKSLPVSNGKAFCLQCGEQLRKPKTKRKMRRRYRS